MQQISSEKILRIAGIIFLSSIGGLFSSYFFPLFTLPLWNENPSFSGFMGAILFIYLPVIIASISIVYFTRRFSLVISIISTFSGQLLAFVINELFGLDKAVEDRCFEFINNMFKPRSDYWPCAVRTIIDDVVSFLPVIWVLTFLYFVVRYLSRRRRSKINE